MVCDNENVKILTALAVIQSQQETMDSKIDALQMGQEELRKTVLDHTVQIAETKVESKTHKNIFGYVATYVLGVVTQLFLKMFEHR